MECDIFCLGNFWGRFWSTVLPHLTFGQRSFTHCSYTGNSNWSDYQIHTSLHFVYFSIPVCYNFCGESKSTVFCIVCSSENTANQLIFTCSSPKTTRSVQAQKTLCCGWQSLISLYLCLLCLEHRSHG